MRQKLISAIGETEERNGVSESSEPIALVWHKLSQEDQQSAVDLISNLIIDYYFSQREGASNYESRCGK